MCLIVNSLNGLDGDFLLKKQSPMILKIRLIDRCFCAMYAVFLAISGWGNLLTSSTL